MRNDGRGPARMIGGKRQGELAQGVVGTPLRRRAQVGVASWPRLDTRIDIKRAAIEAQLHQCDRRHLDRHIHHKVALGDQRLEHATQVIARNTLGDELNPIVRSDFCAASVGGNDRDPIGGGADVAHDQRQRALTNTAEAYENKTTVEVRMNRVCHDAPW